MKLFVLIFLASVASLQADRTIKQKMSTRHGEFFDSTLLSKKANIGKEFFDEDIFEINERAKLNLIDGDIKNDVKERNTITDESLWWGYTVPVQYAPSLPLLARAGIDEARLEYEMRSCVSFPDRTTEDDFIYYQPLSGCFSSVGKMGGLQQISIGSGCEKRGTIQHEMLHALGVYHQQSRTDRDDYIMVMTQNMDEDKVHNFNTYDYNKIDERRVPYDYNSVMHYSDSGFSNNGQKTIVTRDPKFQDVIGQRRDFSDGDISMLNKMYPCSDPIRISYSCGFEEANACGYVQDDKDDTDFVLKHTKDLTSSLDMAPSTDGTFGVKGQGSYMLFNSTFAAAKQQTRMRSMRLKTNTDTQCLEFSYFMDLNERSSAILNVYLAQIDHVTGAIMSTALLTKLSGDMGSYWNLERFTFKSKDSVYKLVFEVESGGYTDDVIAVDNIQIQDKPCETNYFKIQDFSKLLSKTAVGEKVFGPILYDDEGYAFRVFFYPNGKDEEYKDYLAMYFAQVTGENDESLTWPYSDRVIKISLIDQGPEKVRSMSQFSQYITTDEDIWDKPTSETGTGWGWSRFMPLSDILNTRDFVKNDAVIISINIRNMQGEGASSKGYFMPKKSRDAIVTSNHHGHHENNQPDAGDDNNQPIINVEINMVQPNATSEETTEGTSNTMSVGGAIGLAVASVFVTMVIMVVVIISINDSHKKAIKEVVELARMKSSSVSKEGNNNLSYVQQKV